jgi:hypothetical protein
VNPLREAVTDAFASDAPALSCTETSIMFVVLVARTSDAATVVPGESEYGGALHACTVS